MCKAASLTQKELLYTNTELFLIAAYGGYSKTSYGAQGGDDSGGFFAGGGSQQGSQGGGKVGEACSMLPAGETPD